MIYQITKYRDSSLDFKELLQTTLAAMLTTKLEVILADVNKAIDIPRKEALEREFDALCLPSIPKYTPIEIKEIRLDNKASQTVFAAYLNISASTVQKWEQGQKKPNGVALKLLNLVQKRGLEVLTA